MTLVKKKWRSEEKVKKWRKSEVKWRKSEEKVKEKWSKSEVENEVKMSKISRKFFRFPNKHELSIIHTVSRRSWKYGTHSVSLNTSSRAQKLRWYSFWTSFCQDLPKKVDLGSKLSSKSGPNLPDRIFFLQSASNWPSEGHIQNLDQSIKMSWS